MTSGYDLIRITLGQVTHTGHQDTRDGRVWFTACGRFVRQNQDRIYDNKTVLMGLAPDVDCITCLVRKA